MQNEKESLWLLKEAHTMYFDGRKKPDNFKDYLEAALAVDEIDAHVSTEDNVSYRIEPIDNHYSQNCNVKINTTGRYTIITHSTYIDTPNLPEKPSKRKNPTSSILGSLQSLLIGAAILASGIILMGMKDIVLSKDMEIPMTSKGIRITLPTISFDSVRSVGFALLIIGIIFLILGILSIIMNLAIIRFNRRVSHNEILWNEAWKNWETKELLNAYENGFLYDAIYESVNRASYSLLGRDPTMVVHKVTSLSDMQILANSYKAERK